MLAAKSDMNFFVKCVVFGICVCFNLWGLATIFLGDHSVYTWQEAHVRLDDIKSELVQIDKKNATLSNEIRLLQTDPAYLEKIIRQQLNYVKGSEIIYIFEDDGADSYWSRTNTDE